MSKVVCSARFSDVYEMIDEHVRSAHYLVRAGWVELKGRIEELERNERDSAATLEELELDIATSAETEAELRNEIARLNRIIAVQEDPDRHGAPNLVDAEDEAA